jgi:hypothetical protein
MSIPHDVNTVSSFLFGTPNQKSSLRMRLRASELQQLELELTDRSNSMAWSIFLGNPSIKNLPFPSSHPTDLGGLLIVSLMAFSKSCQGSA